MNSPKHPNDGLSEAHPLIEPLRNWYRVAQRDLPWRRTRDPYAIWLSEVILQQTRVEQGRAYWERFIAEFPKVEDLAHAPSERVMKLWQGLGYYSRARNAHRAAKLVAEGGGSFPQSAAGLRELPGVGPYTAAAVASICYGEPVAVVDGNVIRVVSRLLDLELPVDRAPGRAAIEALAAELVDPADPGQSNQAMMELGATVCKPTSPDCAGCPLATGCLAFERGSIGMRPLKIVKIKVEKVSYHFEIQLREGQIWMELRPDRGIWGGLWSLPISENAPLDARAQWGPFHHELTHRRITAWCHLLAIKPGDGSEEKTANGRWVSTEAIGDLPLHRLMERIWQDIGPEMEREG